MFFFLSSHDKVVMRHYKRIVLFHKKKACVRCFSCSHYKNHKTITQQTWSMKQEVKQNIKKFWYSCFASTHASCFTIASLASRVFTLSLRLLLLLRLRLLLLHKCEPGFRVRDRFTTPTLLVSWKKPNTK